MVLHICAQRLSSSPALRHHVIRRLSSALRAARSQVHRVTVRLADLNGPRGGVDKSCRVEVQLARAAPVHIEGRDADVYRAVTIAIDRAGRAVQRRVARRRRS